MKILIWFIVLMISLAALLQGAGWFAAGMAKILGRGKRNEFAAATIGAALPELALALTAVLAGRPELVLPVVLGSSIANILLATGISGLAAKNLPIKKDCVDLDGSLLAAAAVFFYFVVYDGQIVFFEGLLLLAAFLGYGVCLFVRGNNNDLTPRDLILSGNISSRHNLMEIVAARFGRGFESNAKTFSGALALALVGALLLALAGIFTIESLVNIAVIFALSAVVLAMSILSVAGVLPEISSSLEIICKKRYEVVLGNIFASTTVNLLLVTGAAALFSPLPVQTAVQESGLPFFAAAVGLLTISSFPRKISASQGWLFLLFYFLFLSKLFNLF